MPLSHGSTCKASAAGWGFVLSVDCSVESTPGASFCFRFSVKLGAPAEQSTPGKSVRAGDRDAVPGLLTSQRMASFSSLVKLRRLARPSRAESAAVASVKSRSTADSLAAPLALVLICGRALRMKLALANQFRSRHRRSDLANGACWTSRVSSPRHSA
jgi:hypothetical protein